MKILILGDPLANTTQWINGLKKYTDARIELWSLEGSGKKRILQWIQAIFTLRKLVKQINPDVIIGYRITSYGFLAAWSQHKPLVLAAQGITDVWPEHHWTTPFKAMLARYAIKKADMIHVWGTHMQESILKYGGKREQLFIRPRGIDLSEFMCKEEEKPTFSPTINCCVTRALYPEYNHIHILKAINELVISGIPIHLFIAGVGPEKLNIETFIKENNLQQHVSLLGHVSQSNLPALLNKCHLYLTMVNTEGVSASLFEAMACRCYPIVSDLPANRNFIEPGRNGSLVNHESAEDLKNKIMMAIEDKPLLARALDYNIELVKKIADMEVNMKEFILRYKQLTDKEKSVRN